MLRLAIGRPSWVRLISGSLPRFPTRITLFTLPAIAALHSRYPDIYAARLINPRGLEAMNRSCLSRTLSLRRPDEARDRRLSTRDAFQYVLFLFFLEELIFRVS